MKRAVKIILFVLLGLVAIVGLALAYATFQAEQKLNRKIEVNVSPVAFVSTPEAVTQGKYLFDTRGCGECHGAMGEGRVMIDAPNGFYIRTPNITAGGVTARYAERDWDLAVRHGVKPDGKPIFLMPSEDYNRLTDIDFAALVAYIRSLKPAPANNGEVRLPLPMKAVYGLGLMQDAAAKINHSLPPPKPVEVAVTVWDPLESTCRHASLSIL